MKEIRIYPKNEVEINAGKILSVQKKDLKKMLQCCNIAIFKNSNVADVDGITGNMLIC